MRSGIFPPPLRWRSGTPGEADCRTSDAIESRARVALHHDQPPVLHCTISHVAVQHLMHAACLAHLANCYN